MKNKIIYIVDSNYVERELIGYNLVVNDCGVMYKLKENLNFFLSYYEEGEDFILEQWSFKKCAL